MNGLPFRVGFQLGVIDSNCDSVRVQMRGDEMPREHCKVRLVAKVKDSFVPRFRDEIFPTLKPLQTSRCPFKNLPERRASQSGKSLTAEKMEQCRWVKPRLVRSPSSNGPDARLFTSLQLRRHAR